MYLEDKLKNIRQSLSLSEAKKGKILADMLRTIDASEMLNKRAAESAKARKGNWLTSIISRMPVLAAFVAALFLGAGTSFAAQGTLPGDTLYPFKIGINEKVASLLQFTPQAKAGYESKLAATRLDEAAKLASENRLDDNWKNILEANFRGHADAAQKAITSLQDGGDAASAVNLASDFEASLRARRGVIDRLNGSSTVSINPDIEDVTRLRGHAEDEVTSSTVNSWEELKNSAVGKIGSAFNFLDSTRRYFSGLNLATSTLAEAQSKLASAQALYGVAQADFAAGNYADAFTSAQNAIRIAQEARISVSLQNDLNARGQSHDSGVDGKRGRDDESINATSSAGFLRGEGGSGQDFHLQIPPVSTSTVSTRPVIRGETEKSGHKEDEGGIPEIDD